MSEILPNFNPELEIKLQILKVASEHLSREDVAYLDDLESFDKQANYIYDQLVAMGKDPDDVIYGNRI